MACLLVAAAGAPPVASPQFCSDVHEYMVVNGTVPVPSQVIRATALPRATALRGRHHRRSPRTAHRHARV